MMALHFPLRFLIVSLLIFLPILTVNAQNDDQEVVIELDQFGVGNAFRAGEMTAIRLKITSHLPEPVSVWVQWEVPNADGDIGDYGRSLPLQPGRSSFVWLYAPLSPDTTMRSVWPVVVYEEHDEERGRQLGGKIISPGQVGAQIVEMDQTLIGVIGLLRGGLDGLSSPGPGSAFPPSTLEITRIKSGIKPADLPDRWDGLRQYESLYWSNASPAELRDDPAQALEEYIRRGGHLIIDLPSRGNPWGLGRPGMVQKDIERLLPARDPPQEVDVPLSEMLGALTKSTTTESDPKMTVRVFANLQNENWELSNAYEPLIALPDGRIVVIQRRHGMGRITIIGIELDKRLASMGIPQADRFWNRILGRRADAPTGVELAEIKKEKHLADLRGTELFLGSGRFITRFILMDNKASVGLLLAMVLFIIYWVVAGPGGYSVLKAYKQVQHAWLAFAGASLLFTAGAWFTMNVSRSRQIEVKHFTVLDHIALPRKAPRTNEPQLQRAASWFTVYTPKYGTTKMSLDSTTGQRDLLMSWHPPSMAVQRFPNVDRFRRNVGRDEAKLALPSRATSTQLYAHWMGGVPRSWGGMIREDPDQPITVRMDPLNEREVGLTGNLLHDLPGDLVNVKLIWIQNKRTPPRGYAQDGPNQSTPWVEIAKSGQMLNLAYTWSSNPIRWPRNTPLPLAATLTTNYRLERNIKKDYFDPFVGSLMQAGTGSGNLSEKDRRRHLEMLSMFHQLAPPPYLKRQEKDPTPDLILPRRLNGRELDLSGWFTRPCLIVIGYLENTPIPIPLRVNGDEEPPSSEGLTMIRWIYPLPLNPHIAFPEPP